MLVSLPSQHCFCTSLPFSSVTTVCKRREQKSCVHLTFTAFLRSQSPSPVPGPGPGLDTHPGLPVVGGGLVERLVELEPDLGGLERALGLHAHGALLVHRHHQVGLGPVANLAGGEADACTERRGRAGWATMQGEAMEKNKKRFLK